MSRLGVGFTGSYGVPGNDAFTKVLLHFDGANGGTTFIDENAAGLSNTWAPTWAGPTISTADQKFGGASLLYPAGYHPIITATKTAFDPGSGPFTVDFWYNPGSAANSYDGLAFLGTNSAYPANYSWSIARPNPNGKIQIQLSDGSSQPFASGSTSVTAGWHHIAMVRNGSSALLFVDGVLDLTMSFSSSVQPSSGNLTVGTDVVGISGVKYIDEFRLSVGIARWTSNFMPPNAPYI